MRNGSSHHQRVKSRCKAAHSKAAQPDYNPGKLRSNTAIVCNETWSVFSQSVKVICCVKIRVVHWALDSASWYEYYRGIQSDCCGVVQALAAPDDAPRKTRGGKRMRKIKEKYQSSDLMQQASRVAFASQDEGLYTGNTMESLGMIGEFLCSSCRVYHVHEVSVPHAIAVLYVQLFGGRSVS